VGSLPRFRNDDCDRSTESEQCQVRREDCKLVHRFHEATDGSRRDRIYPGADHEIAGAVTTTGSRHRIQQVTVARSAPGRSSKSSYRALQLLLGSKNKWAGKKSLPHQKREVYDED